MAESCFSTLATVRKYWEKYVESGFSEIPLAETRGFPQRPVDVYHSKMLDSETVAQIESWMLEFNEEDGGATIPKLQGKLEAEKNLKVTSAVLRYVLTKKLGFKWGPSKKVSLKIRKSLLRTKQIREFLILFANALELESSGDYVIVYMDETFCHQRHSSNWTWYRDTDPAKNKVRTGSGKGKRFIILHAITKHGLLCSEEDQRLHDDWELKEQKDSAEWIFVGKVKKEDYHKNMNSQNFMKWIEKRLFPAFETKFAGKKMILVLDNAPYHWGRDENYVDPKQMTRDKTIEFLLAHDITEVTGVRAEQQKTFALSDAKNTRCGSRNAPYKHELQSRLEAYLKTRPDLQKSKLQSLFQAKGHSLIFTPPYTPSVQPIELVWAYVKNYVAKKFRPGRTLEIALDHIHNGFYGDPDDPEVDGITKQRCQDLIRKCIRACNEFVARDDALSGTIHDLHVNNNPAPLTEDEQAELEREHEEAVGENDTYFTGFDPVQDEGAYEDSESVSAVVFDGESELNEN